MKTMKTCATLGAAAAVIAGLAAPALSSGHMTVSTMQPQGAAKTGARTLYVVRAPNEKARQATYRVVTYVPEAVQQSISVKPAPGWRTKLTRVATGQKDEEGNDVMKTTRISFTARTPDEEIEPGMFGEWNFRFQNPTAPQALCFQMLQFYRGTDGTRKNAEVVAWTGAPSDEKPRSCVSVVA